MTYTTKDGDTWDKIAYKVYGNELYCDKVMDNNREYLGYMVFPKGISLTLPNKETFLKETIDSDEPLWRRA